MTTFSRLPSLISPSLSFSLFLPSSPSSPSSPFSYSYALAVGEMSGPVYTDSGIHLILRTA